MNTLRQAVQEYLVMRRSFGFKLEHAGPALLDFVSFLQQHRASYITQAWRSPGPTTAGVQPDEWAQRLSFVRIFARHRSATDPRTQVPPPGCCRSGQSERDRTCTPTRRLQLLRAALNMPCR